jgi:hypothetical protein
VSEDAQVHLPALLGYSPSRLFALLVEGSMVSSALMLEQVGLPQSEAIDTGLDSPQVLGGWQTGDERAVFLLAESGEGRSAGRLVLVETAQDQHPKLSEIEGPASTRWRVAVGASPDGLAGIDLYFEAEDGAVQLQRIPIDGPGASGTAETLLQTGGRIIAAGGPAGVYGTSSYLELVRADEKDGTLELVRISPGDEPSTRHVPGTRVPIETFLFSRSATLEPTIAGIASDRIAVLNVADSTWKRAPLNLEGDRFSELHVASDGSPWLLRITSIGIPIVQRLD